MEDDSAAWRGASVGVASSAGGWAEDVSIKPAASVEKTNTNVLRGRMTAA